MKRADEFDTSHSWNVIICHNDTGSQGDDLIECLFWMSERVNRRSEMFAQEISEHVSERFFVVHNNDALDIRRFHLVNLVVFERFVNRKPAQ